MYKIKDIENTLRCYVSENPLTLDFIQESVKNQELRKKWLEQGKEDALLFIEQYSKTAPLLT